MITTSTRALVALTLMLLPVVAGPPADAAPAGGPHGDRALAAPADDLRGDITFSVPSGTFTTSVTVSLGSPAAGAQIRYTTDGSVPTGGSTVYTGPLTLTATTQLRAQAFTSGAAAGRPGTQLYVRRAVDAAANDLPLLLVDDYGQGKPGREYVDAAVMLFDGGTSTTSLAATPAVATRAGVHLRGQSSAMFDKAPYRLEFRGNDDDDADHPVLGMPADSDWVLRGPFPDKSLVREALVMELSRQIGLAAPRYRFVELYLNGDRNPVAADDYQGVYLLEETIKNSKDRLDLKQLDPDDTTLPAITGGYIFSFEWLAAEEPTLTCTGPAATCWNFLEVRDPDPLVPEQRAWLQQHVQQFHDMLHSPDFATRYPSWIDVDSWINMIIMNELSRDMDSYVRSAYFHKDRGGPIVAGPMWDHDLTFGVGGFANNTQTAGWQHQNLQIRQPPANDWFTVLLTDPAFVAKLKARWQSLRGGVLSDASLAALIDRLTVPLTAAADRNFRKWPNLTAPVVGPFTTPTAPTWQGQVQALRTWLTQRTTWLDSAAGWGAPTAAGACTAAYTTTSQWNGGFQGEVTVTAGSAPIRGWTVTLTFTGGQTVSQVWNGLPTTSGNQVTVRNESYNGALGAAARTTFGLLGSGSGPGPAVSCAVT